MRGWLVLVVGIVAATGCQGSRWAKRDADYRQKYSKHTDDPVKTIKQAVDARHVRGKLGSYATLAGREAPFAGGWDTGVFQYPTPWLEQRLGFSGLIHEGGKRPVSLGMLSSHRVQVPTRLAPFVGVGGYLGWAGGEMREEPISDPGDPLVTKLILDTKHEFVVAAFPEVGAHFWIDHRRRLTASASYWFTNQDYNEDFLFFSIGFSWFDSRYEDHRTKPNGEFLMPETIELPPPSLDEQPLAESPYAELTIVEPGSVNDAGEPATHEGGDQQ